MRKKYGILAYPAGHSLSPVMQNAAFQAAGLEADYVLFERRPEELEGFMQEMRDGLAWGVSVSLPHKVEVMKYLDWISDEARIIGAVNTVVRTEEGKLHGYNTDWMGAQWALLDALGEKDLDARAVVILGAGGSARAVAYACLEAGADVWVKNRTRSKADGIAIDLAEHFEEEIHSVDFSDMGTGDILINTTSVWLGKESWQETLLVEYCDPEYLKSFELVMDIVYRPLITPLLEAAMDSGVPVVTGEKMLMYQGAKQFELWTGKEAPVEEMWEALKELL